MFLYRYRDTDYKTTLYVRPHAGENLIAKDRGNTSDPFCVFGMIDANGKWIGKQTKTEVAKATLEPNFWESETFEIPDYCVGVRVECWDYNAIGSNSPMGQFVLNLQDLIIGEKNQSIWCRLEAKGKEKVSGYIHVDYEYMTADYKRQKDDDSKARDAAELELISSIHKGTEQFIDMHSIKILSEHFVYASMDGFLSDDTQINTFFNRFDWLDNIRETFGLGFRYRTLDSAIWVAHQLPEVKAIVHKHFMRFFDVDNDGKISFNEVLRGMGYFYSDLEDKLVAMRYFMLLDVASQRTLTMEGVRALTRDRFFVLSKIVELQIGWTLKNDKTCKKGYKDGDESAMKTIANVVAEVMEKMKYDEVIANEYWEAMNKVPTDTVSLDEWTEYYTANQYQADCITEDKFTQFHEAATEAAKASLAK